MWFTQICASLYLFLILFFFFFSFGAYSLAAYHMVMHIKFPCHATLLLSSLSDTLTSHSTNGLLFFDLIKKCNNKSVLVNGLWMREDIKKQAEQTRGS